jgi:hypothetical protein
MTNIVVPFGVHETLQSVSLGEPFDEPHAMLENAMLQIACHADIKCPVGSVRHDVNPTAGHSRLLAPPSR